MLVENQLKSGYEKEKNVVTKYAHVQKLTSSRAEAQQADRISVTKLINSKNS